MVRQQKTSFKSKLAELIQSKYLSLPTAKMAAAMEANNERKQIAQKTVAEGLQTKIDELWQWMGL